MTEGEYWQDQFNRHNEAALQSGAAAGRMLMLINGAAAAALLTFIGGLAETDFKNHIPAISNAVTSFAWGVACAAATVCIAYLINLLYAGAASKRVQEPKHKVGWWLWPASVLSIAAIGTGALSLLFFMCGVYRAKNGFPF